MSDSFTAPSIKPIILFGFASGGMIDGIVFHQLLQWHHMISHSMPTMSQVQWMVWTDGLFHGGTYLLLVISGLWMWRMLVHHRLPWNSRHIIGGLLSGWGIFNVVEGFLSHYLLGIHHVNETVAPEQWYLWDASFLVWGLVMVILGIIIGNQGKHLAQP